MDVKGRERTKKRYTNYVRQDIKEMDVNNEMTSNRREWKKKKHCSDIKSIGM